jgi:DNA-binding SARP family transcriptional activator
MEFRILGRLEVISSDGQVVTVSRPQLRAAIFVLALHGDQSVTCERLVRLLWGEDGQDRSHGLRNCMWGVRQVLPPGRLVTDDVGYRLRVDPHHDTVDVATFRELYRQGRAAHQRGDNISAASLLERGLKLWRDPPLINLLPRTTAMEALVTGLGMERDAARDTMLDARLALGEHRDLLPALRTLVVQEPLNEHLRALLMLALYRYGLNVDALKIFDEGRDVLRAEADTEPGVELRRLRRQILDDDPVLNLRSTANSPAGEVGGGLAPIAQLPPDIRGFTGRSDEAAELTALLTPGDGATAVPIAEVTGPPGVGKTCLAVHVAHTIREHYPDGQLYLHLAGASPHPRDPGEVLSEVLRALGVPAAEIPETTEQRAAVYRSRLADRRILVVADDAASLDQIRPLLPGTAGCAVVITTRVQLTAVAGGHLISLEPFERAEALTMLGRIIGHPRMNAERDAAAEVVAACGGFPLAVRIAGARLAARPAWPVARLAGLLADERRRLDELVAGDLAVRASLGLSYQALDARARRAFRLLALAGPHDIAGWVVAALVGEPDADDVLEALVDRGLLAAVAVDALGRPRYRLHDLLRDYAGELLAGDPEYEPARERLFSAWLELAGRADESMPHEPYFPAPSGGSYTILSIEAADCVLGSDPRTWLDVERINILAMINVACAAGKYRPAVGLALRLASFLMVHGHHDDAERMWRTVADAAEHAGDTEVSARTRFRAAVVIAHDRGRHAEAMPMANACIAAFERSGDRRDLARGLALRAYCAQSLTQLDSARCDAERGLSLARAAGDAHAEFSCLRVLGHTMSQFGHHDLAIRYSEEAVTVARRLADDTYEGIALYTLIHVLLQAGCYERAPDLCKQALELAARVGTELGTGYFHQQLGIALHEMGDHSAAVDQLSAAVRDFEDCHADRLAALCRLKIAESLASAGCRDAAIETLEACLPIFQTLGMPAEEEQAQTRLTSYRAQADT